MTLSLSARPYATLLLLSIGHFLVDFMIGIWPVYKTMAGIDLAVAGMIYAISATLGEGMQAIFGNMSDRGWRKPLVLGGMLVTTVGSLFAFTTDYSVLFIIFLIICTGSGAFHPAAMGLVSRLSEKNKSFYVTHFAAFGSLGLATSQIVYAYLYGALDGNTLYIALPTIAVILFSLQKRWVVTPKRIQGEAPAPHFKLFFEFFKRKEMRSLYLSQVCNQTILWSTIFLLPDVLKSRGYSDWVVFGGGHFIFIMGGVCLLMPSGLLADRFSSRSVIVSACAFGGLLLYSFLAFPQLSDMATLSILFCLGASLSIVNPVSVALGHRFAPDHPGMVSAYLMGCVWCVSEFLGPGGGGLLTKLFEEDAPARALMVIGLLSIAGFYFANTLPAETREEELSGKERESNVA